jgi:hypothetical protein
MEFPFDGGILVVQLEDDPPSWVGPTVKALGQLLRLSSGWDSYGACPINPYCVAQAIRLARDIMHQRTPAPTVVPTTSGGVQLEWHTRGVDLEIEVESPSRISVSFQDHRTGESWDADDLDNFAKVRVILAAIAQRTN